MILIVFENVKSIFDQNIKYFKSEATLGLNI